MATTMMSSAHLTIAVPNAAKRDGFFTRFKDALIASRMRAAEREIARYRHLHENLMHPAEQAGLPVRNSKDAMPF
ncbi:MAG: hypothetical protein ACRCTD_03005 [Beijerinckiaceae bacterium]